MTDPSAGQRPTMEEVRAEIRKTDELLGTYALVEKTTGIRAPEVEELQWLRKQLVLMLENTTPTLEDAGPAQGGAGGSDDAAEEDGDGF